MALTEEEAETWTDESGKEYTPVCTHEMLNSKIESGWVEGHPVDTLYLLFDRHLPPGEVGQTLLLLRPDEMAALAWLANGILMEALGEAQEELEAANKQEGAA